MTTQSSNKDERRSSIIQAAFKLFGQVGYSKATMKDIASKAGVAQGLIGYHFSTKEALLVEVVKEWMINKGLKEAFASLDLNVSPAELLHQGLRHVVRFRKENPEWFTLLISLWTESVGNEMLAKEIQGLYKEMKSAIIEIIDRLELPLEQGEKEILASLFQAVFDGLSLQAPVPLSPEPLSFDQISRGIGWMLDGIRSADHNKEGEGYE